MVDNEKNVSILDYFKYFDKYEKGKRPEACLNKRVKEPSLSEIVKKGDTSELLDRCQVAWQGLEQLRIDRERNIEYKNGNQWCDIVNDPENRGKRIKESELLVREGKSPLKHNFIQQFIRNLSGQMINSPTQSVVYARTKDDINLGEMLTNTLQACHHLNQVSRLDIGLLEELILSGIGCCKVRYEYWDSKNKGDGKLEIVASNRLFYNSDVEDIRMSELSIIGEIHDYTIGDVIKNFAKTPDDEKIISRIYSSVENNLSYSNEVGSFLIPSDKSKCRVIEVWDKRGRWKSSLHDYLTATISDDCKMSDREVDKINRERVEETIKLGREPDDTPLLHIDRHYEHYWNVSFISPTGELLHQRETPYAHREHPYVLTTIPAIDGNPRGVINDLIDIQRYINRLIVMIDFIMGASAKGVLMVPENSIPDGMSVDDFTSEYVKANGVIVYKPNNMRDVPFQISSNSTNVGAWEMLGMQMKLIQEISGISGAIQGYSTNSNTPSSLYAQQAQNSQLNYKVLFETIKYHQSRRDEKLLKVLMQYYKGERYISVAGATFGDTVNNYEPKMVSELIDFNLVISQSVSTPLYRQINDDLLKSMLDRGQIDLEMFLTNSSLPFADKLLTQLQAKKGN